jgi:shikimate kinase
MNLYLIGYRGTGKTSVAGHLAKQLDRRLVDTDDEVERAAGRSIAEIFSDAGEDAFRDLESDCLVRLAEQDALVVATGGGAVLRPESRQAMQSSGRIVWLEASAESIEARLADDPVTSARRPNLTRSGGLTEIRDLLAQRSPIYRTLAHLRVDTEQKTPAEVADAVAAWFEEAQQS